MQTLDLSNFYGINPDLLTPTELDAVRHRFAGAVVDCAAHCASNREFLDTLYRAMPLSGGLLYPQLVGVGSCRITYVTSFGLVLKITRTDPLEPEELEWRGGKEYLPKLRQRRVFSNWNEVLASGTYCNATPRIYGAAISFRGRPNVIVSEAVRPLDHYYPDDRKGVLNEHLHFSHVDGRLIISDRRFSSEKPHPDDTC